jgi:serine/threonine-protein kinase
MRCGGSVDPGASRPSASFISPFEALRDQLAEATAGEYRILHELGRGGMAAVYLAEDLALGRRVAIKVMVPGLDATDGMADRFLLEARTAAQLGHPHIIPIYAVRTTDLLRYFVMKFVGGRSLDRVLAETGPLPIPVVLAILAQVGAALEHAHRRGVVHRDIKPANIMLDDDGSTIVADFGIAKVAQGVSLTQTGSTVGTPTYMSPEQCTGKPVTGASDQYALGCVAFELLAGRPPFVHQEVVPVLLAHVSDAAPPLLPLRRDCPMTLAATIDRMLAKEPGERWPTLGEALIAAESAGAAADPAVRTLMRELSGAGEEPIVQPMPSIPLSPLPAPRPRTSTRISAPRPEPTSDRPVLAVPFAVTIQPNGASLQAGSGLQLQATVRDRTGLPLPDAAVDWRSADTGIVAVSVSGVITALAEGETEVMASIDGVRAAIQVRVARVPVALLRLSPVEGAWQVGERYTITAVTMDQSGAILPGRGIRWTSLEPTVATVDADGVVQAIAEGQARIQAECEGRSAELAVDVRGLAGQLDVIPGEGALAVGQVVRLLARWKSGVEGFKAAPGATWSSSDPTILRVTPQGELTGIRPGSGRVRAAYGGQWCDVTFHVSRVDVAAVRIEPRPTTLEVGEVVRLQATASDRLGSSLPGRIVTWASSQPEIIAIAPDGTLRGVAPGRARISASVGAGVSVIEVKVAPVTVVAVRIEPAAVSLRVGESAQLEAVAQGQKGGLLRGLPVIWQSSDEAIARVSPAGVVTGLRFGTARVAATVGGRRATMAVEVRGPSTISAPKLRVGG